MPTFPTQPDQLTAEWFTAMFRDAGVLGADRSVTSFESASVGEGLSLLGVVHRTELTYSEGDGAAGPDTVVIKFATLVEANRAIAMNTNMYQREIDFFRSIAPRVEMPLAACYFADIVKETGDNIVVLEDLKAYRAGDQLTGIDLGEAKAIIDAYVPLNAAFWGKTDDPLLDDCMRIDSSYVEPFLPGVYGTWERCRELFADSFAPDVLAALPRYIDSMRDLHRLMGERTQTLVHGDIRLDNVMFGQTAEQAPIVLIDWQAIMVSNPMQDLGYMLSQSMDTELRRAHEDELIAYYRDRITGLGVEGYTLEQARADYDVAVLWIMCYPVIIGGVCDPTNDRGRELAAQVIQRSTQTVSDRGLLSLLP